MPNLIFTQPDVNGNFTIVTGDDYKAADGRAFQWVNGANGNWPNLTGAAVTFACSKTPFGFAFGPWPLTVVTPTGASATVQLELPTVDTQQLLPSVGVYDSYGYSVIATLASGDVVTLAQGQMTVLPK